MTRTNSSSIGGKAGQVDASGKVADLERMRTEHSTQVGEAVAGGPLHDHPSRTIRAAPDDGAVGEDVADLQALLEQRPLAAHNRGRGLRTQDAGQTGGHRPRDNGGLLKEAAAWIAAMF